MAKGSGTEAHEKFQVTVQVSWALEFSKYLYIPFPPFRKETLWRFLFRLFRAFLAGAAALHARNPWCYGSARPVRKKVSRWPATRKSPSGNFSERYVFFIFSYTAVSTTYQTCPISNRVSRNHPSKEPRRVLSLSSHLFVLLIAVRPKNKCSNHISYLEQYTRTRGWSFHFPWSGGSRTRPSMGSRHSVILAVGPQVERSSECLFIYDHCYFFYSAFSPVF